LHKIIPLTLIDKKATTNAATSLSMWKLSATRAMELVTYPTTISTRKKKRVSQNIDTRRHFFPVKRPITLFSLQQKKEKKRCTSGVFHIVTS
jgi:hypothetical protein